MSLVAYAASSDEESENEEENSQPQVQLLKPTSVKSTNTSNNNNNNHKNNEKANIASTNGHISDDDDDYIPQEVSLQELKPPANGRLTLSLPKPKAAIAPTEEEEDEEKEKVTQAFAKLPMPRAAASSKVFIAEEDDEFLHKKAIPMAVSEKLEKPPAAAVKTRVKISIPSLRDFADVDKEKAEKQQSQQDKQTGEKPRKGSSLLSILPQAKSERDFAKKSTAPLASPAKAAQNSLPPPKPISNAPKPAPAAKPAFVPDTVKQRRAAHNTEGVDGVVRAQSSSKSNPKPTKPAASLVSVSDSDEDEDEDGNGDFFSLKSEQKLPEVSSNEVSALVAKRAAKMMEASNKYLTEVAAREAAEKEAAQLQAEELREAQKRYHEQQLNTEAMDALVGKNAKRRRKEAKEMQNVIDITGTQVMPDREEWMRTALASATTYQPTGVLTDEEPVAGTRRKHQITYLAHKAKANEAELQAMWSANRQTRRATQSKYGF